MHLLTTASSQVPAADLGAAVAKALDSVNLTEWANVLSSKFSGGMKRRLSTACALVGDPKAFHFPCFVTSGVALICALR